MKRSRNDLRIGWPPRRGAFIAALAILLLAAFGAFPAGADPVCVSPDATAGERAAAALVAPVAETGRFDEALETFAGILRHAGTRASAADYALDRTEALRQLSGAPRGRASVTWFGHSSFLLQMGGRRILVDPVFEHRLIADIPPFTRRLAPLPLDVGDLPPIDTILISHADRDHLDLRTLRRLAAGFPAAAVVVPPGLDDLARRAGFTDVRALPWFAVLRFGRLTVRAVPAQHASRRGLGDADRCWSGYSLTAEGRRVFFAGDTGYGPLFAALRKLLGRFDVAFVPIGSSGDAAVEAGRHVTSRQAVQLARDLGAWRAIAMHWGTYALTPEEVHEPLYPFLAAGGHGVEPRVMWIGQTMPLFAR